MPFCPAVAPALPSLSRSSSVLLLACATAAVLGLACSPQASGPPAETTAAPPPAARDFSAPGSAGAATAAAVPAVSTAAASSASTAPAPSSAPAAPATPSTPETAPRGKVSNIGMHIGGGPNDDVTKEPIRKSVQPHFEAFRRCYGKAAEAKPADFGIDLHIPREGGKATLQKPRSTLKDEPFKACVVQTFEGIEFLKPKGGETVVSYSLRFTP